MESYNNRYGKVILIISIISVLDFWITNITGGRINDNHGSSTVLDNLNASNESGLYHELGRDQNSSSYFSDLFNLSARKVMSFPKPDYLSDVRNPCFYADISSKNYLR